MLFTPGSENGKMLPWVGLAAKVGRQAVQAGSAGFEFESKLELP